MKTGLIIRHVPYEGVAAFRVPIEAAGYVLDRIDVADPDFASLDLAQHDLLIMMGGPMGVYEQDCFPWIACQLQRLRLRLERDLPTLGVCFGAQMIAAALDAHVFAGPSKEVGFHPISLTAAGADSPLRHVDEVPILHWHGDTFTLPDNTELLASSHVYAHQAFRRGRNLLALQFHAEMGEDPRFESWLDGYPDFVVEAGSDVSTLRAAHDRHGPGAVAAGQRMIAEWLAQLR